MKTIQITAAFAAQITAIETAGKTPWVIINEDCAVGAYAGRNEARAAKAAETLAGAVVKASEVQFETSKPVAPVGAEIEGSPNDYLCPHCGIDLDNGIGVHMQEVNGKYIKHEKFEYVCLACDTEFGPAIAAKSQKKEAAKTHEITNTSTVERPCKLVWQIADEMPGARRKDVIAAAQAQGVAFYTARTQYQLWAQVQLEMAEREAAQAKKAGK